MNKKLAALLVDIDPTGEIEIYENYSGRGMYGDTTTGVTAPSLAILLENVLEAVKDGSLDEEIIEDIDIGRLNSDSLGFDVIVY